LNALIEKVNDYISIFSDHQFRDTKVGEVLDDVAATRGKMLRPRVLLLAGAYGPRFETAKERLLKLAAMVELTHMASLIHDDIVDDAPFRRSKPTLQMKYGKDQAVYAGDFLMSHVSYFALKEKMIRSGLVLAKTVEEMCAGEIGQAECRYRENITEQEYMRNIHGKTAALFMAACRIGATESGCTKAVIHKLEQFGEYLGIMFQLRDDLLDFTSDVQSIGKEAHKDFRDGIYTMPVICALRHPRGPKELLPVMRSNAAEALTDEQILIMRRLVAELDGVKATRQEIRIYQKRAEDIILKSLPRGENSSLLLEMLHDLRF